MFVFGEKNTDVRFSFGVSIIGTEHTKRPFVNVHYWYGYTRKYKSSFINGALIMRPT